MFQEEIQFQEETTTTKKDTSQVMCYDYPDIEEMENIDE